MKSVRGAKSVLTTLYVKNMVCDRCVRIVREELERISLDVRSVKLGEAVVASSPEPDMDAVRNTLRANGFELIDDRKAKIIERVKTSIINLIHHSDPEKSRRMKTSELIAKEVGYDYPYLSGLFSSVENITIEKFIILQRIERVKELIVYNELTLSEIAYKTGFSSVQHLSNQFKKNTGLTPSYFRKVKKNKRVPLDKVG